jgi:hypothetical protein
MLTSGLYLPTLSPQSSLTSFDLRLGSASSHIRTKYARITNTERASISDDARDEIGGRFDHEDPLPASDRMAAGFGPVRMVPNSSAFATGLLPLLPQIAVG